jgi:hypothetical protein
MCSHVLDVPSCATIADNEQVSTFGSAHGSAVEDLSDNSEPDESSSRIPIAQRVERIWKWVDYGTYGVSVGHSPGGGGCAVVLTEGAAVKRARRE